MNPGEQEYRVEVYEGFWEDLARLSEAQQLRITDFMALHFAVRPRVVIPGQLKRLKATYSHLYQLDCGKDRLLYEVDDDRMTVRIVYVGPHPDWSKRRRSPR